MARPQVSLRLMELETVLMAMETKKMTMETMKITMETKKTDHNGDNNGIEKHGDGWIG